MASSLKKKPSMHKTKGTAELTEILEEESGGESSEVYLNKELKKHVFSFEESSTEVNPEEFLKRGEGEKRRQKLAEEKRARLQKEKSSNSGGFEAAINIYKPEDYPQQWIVFQVLDIDKNGWITGRELKMRMRAAGIEQQADNIMALVDINKDMKISFDEFVSSFNKIWHTNAGVKLLEKAMEIAASEGIDMTACKMSPQDMNAEAFMREKQRREDSGEFNSAFLEDSIPQDGFLLDDPDNWREMQTEFFREKGPLGLDIYNGECTEEAIGVLPDVVFRIFLSSTFTDTSAERNLLMSQVWPELRQFCMERGVQFEVVDMRWGIRDECTDDQQTVNICMSEINRCQKEAIGPNFVYLAADKYGWRPPPTVLGAEMYERLWSRATPDDKTLLDDWYQRDENRDPPLYVLQRISKVIPKFVSEVQQERWDAGDQWWDVQGKLMAAFSRAAEQHQQVWTQLSVTELEVHKGILNNHDRDTNAFVFHRRITSNVREVSSHKLGRFYIDMVDGKVDKSSQYLLGELRRKVKEAVSPANWRHYDISWRGPTGEVENGITVESHGQYVRSVCLDIRQALLGSMHKALTACPLPDPLTREILRHMRSAAKESRLCVCREAALKQVRSYITGATPSDNPLVLFGSVGCGKTVLMARAAMEAKKDLGPKSCVLMRFCGSTAGSSVLQRLLRGVVAHLCTIYAAKAPMLPDNLEDLCKMLSDLCTAIPKEKPLVMFIDSLDSIELPKEEAPAAIRQWAFKWLPKKLPRSCKIVVSINQSHEQYKTFRSWDWPDESFLEVGDIPLSKTEYVVSRWLKEDGRNLQPFQMKELLDSMSDSRSGASGLLVRLAYEHTLKWASYDKEESLPRSVNGYIQEIFQHLEKYYGYELVSKAFSYLVCSRHGLSEREWMDLLSCDDDVMKAVLQYHTPPIMRLPPAVFTRMRQEVSSYLVERSADGVPVYCWKYKPFHDVAAARYIKTGVRRQVCLKLANYFDGILHYQFMEREIDSQPLFFKTGKPPDIRKMPNMRKLGELPQALLDAGERDRLVERLSDLEIFALFASDQVLMQDLRMYWRDCSDVADPVECYTEQLEMREKMCDDEESRLELARLYKDVGRFFNQDAKFEAAITMSESSLRLKEDVLGEEDFQLADDLDSLSLMYGSMGMFEEALPLMERSIELLKAEYGPEDPKVAVSLNNLASLHQSLGEHDRALPLYQKVLGIFEVTCGPDSAEVGIIRSNIGSLYAEQGLSVRAQDEMEPALRILKDTYGEQHPKVANCLNNLATVCIQNRDSERALPLLEQDYQTSEKMLGPEHPDLAVTLNNLSLLHSRMRNHVRANQYATRAKDINLEVYENDHIQIAKSLNTLAGVYTAQQQYLRALPLYEQSLQVLQGIFGENHRECVRSKRNLAAVLQQIPGRLPDSLPLAQSVLDILEDHCNEKDPPEDDDVLEVAQAQQELAELHEMLGNFQSAIEGRLEAIKHYSKVLKDTHHIVTVKYNQLAILYERLERHDDALGCVKDRLDLSSDHGRILPPPTTVEDILDSYFLEEEGQEPM